MLNYSKSVIYTISNIHCDGIYVGSTTQFRRRYTNHRYICNHATHRDHNMYVYRFIRSHGGWDAFTMDIIEKYPCNNIFELLERERYYIYLLNPSLNIQKYNILRFRK